jgi:hypothetical protein
MGLWGYKRYVHPARTARRAAVRSVTPKPVRKARRAVTTVRHPASSLEGATKAGVSRSVSRKSRSRKTNNGTNGTNRTGFVTFIVMLFAALLCFAPSIWLWDKHAWWGYISAVAVGLPLYPLGAVVVVTAFVMLFRPSN